MTIEDDSDDDIIVAEGQVDVNGASFARFVGDFGVDLFPSQLS